jgi:tetratricopeptide (TPR) repeat protein
MTKSSLQTKLSLFLLSLICFSAFSVQAQNSKLTSADTYIQNGELQRAWEALDAAKQHEKTAMHPKTYFYEARLYLAVFYDTTNSYSSLSSDPLLDAKKSLETAYKYDQEKRRMKNNIILKADELSRNLYATGFHSYQNEDYARGFKYADASYDAYNIIYNYGEAEGIDTAAMYFSAVCAQLAEMPNEAKPRYNKLIEMSYNNTAIYRNLSQIYAAEEDYESLEQVLRQGREKYPQSQELLIEELNYFLSQGRASEAVAQFEEAIAADPENPELHFAKGTAFQELVKLDSANADAHREEARKSYEKAIELNPSSFDANLNLGALYYNEGVLLQDELDEVDISDEETAKRLESERDAMWNASAPYFAACAAIFEADLKGDKTIPPVYAVEVYRSLGQIYVRQKEYEKSKEAKARMAEIEAMIGG